MLSVDPDVDHLGRRPTSWDQIQIRSLLHPGNVTRATTCCIWQELFLDIAMGNWCQASSSTAMFAEIGLTHQLVTSAAMIRGVTMIFVRGADSKLDHLEAWGQELLPVSVQYVARKDISYVPTVWMRESKDATRLVMYTRQTLRS